MHEIAGQFHWHEPPASNAPASASSTGRRRPTTCSWRRRASRSTAISASARCRTCRWSLETHGRQGHLHPAPWHRRQMGRLRGRGSGRRRAQSRKAHVRGSLSRGRRPRLDRSLARRRQQAPRVRMAEGLDVLDSGQRHAPHRQRQFLACAADRRHHRAESDEPHQQHRGDVQLSVPVPRPLLRRRRFLQVQGRHRARSGARLAMRRTNFIPDIVHCDLPLDNRRSPAGAASSRS